MVEDIILYIGKLDTYQIYLILFFFSFIENVFPPSPSDIVVVVGSSLIAVTAIGFMPILFITSLGSSMGFMIMYYVGKFFGEKVLNSGKIKFLESELIYKSEKWFNKYGYKLILANRFLPGTRSVISFFSGVSELSFAKTFICATISAFLWNIILVYMGSEIGNNVKLIDKYLVTYSNIALIITAIVIFLFLIKFIIGKKKKSENENI